MADRGGSDKPSLPRRTGGSASRGHGCGSLSPAYSNKNESPHRAGKIGEGCLQVDGMRPRMPSGVTPRTRGSSQTTTTSSSKQLLWAIHTIECRSLRISTERRSRATISPMGNPKGLVPPAQETVLPARRWLYRSDQRAADAPACHPNRSIERAAHPENGPQSCRLGARLRA